MTGAAVVRRLLLVRHGQTSSNVAGLLDTALPGAALTETGLRQAVDLVASVSDVPIAAVHSSAALRAQQSAAPLAAARRLPVRVHPDLREVAAGDWEMSGQDDAVQGYLAAVGHWMAGDLDRRVPGAAGESGREVLGRVDCVIAQALFDPVEDDVAVVVVAHGALIRFWAGSRAENLDAEFVAHHPLRNTGIVTLEGDFVGGWVCTGWTGFDIPARSAAARSEPGRGEPARPADPAAADIPVG